MIREDIIKASLCSECEMDCGSCNSDIGFRALAVDGSGSGYNVKCPFELGAEWMQERYKDLLTDIENDIERLNGSVSAQTFKKLQAMKGESK